MNYLEKYKNLYSGKQRLTLSHGGKAPEGHYYGNGSEFIKKVLLFADYTVKVKSRAITILDYGCGQAMHVHDPSYRMIGTSLKSQEYFQHLKKWIQCYYCYDPAVNRYSVRPTEGTLFDIVAIPDVLEHVPEPFVEDVVRDALTFLKPDGLCVATISNTLALAHFVNPDGTMGDNLHCTLKPLEWWIDIFNKYIDQRAMVICHQEPAHNINYNSKTELVYYKQDSSEFYIDTKEFPFTWVDK